MTQDLGGAAGQVLRRGMHRKQPPRIADENLPEVGFRLRRHVRTVVESGGFATAEMGCDSEVVGGEGTVDGLVEQSLAGFDPKSRAAFVAPDHDVVDPPWWYP
jgi:hypothetical protein